MNLLRLLREMARKETQPIPTVARFRGEGYANNLESGGGGVINMELVS